MQDTGGINRRERVHVTTGVYTEYAAESVVFECGVLYVER